MNRWYRYFQQLARKLPAFIHERTMASICYQELAAQTTNHPRRELLLKFSVETSAQAAALRRVYQQITGEPAPLRPIPTPWVTSYKEELRRQGLAESAAFVKYGDEFLAAPDPYLRNLFYKLGASAINQSISLLFHLDPKV